MAWTEKVASTADDLADSIALALEIKGLADAVYTSGVDDSRLVKINQKAEEIRKAIARVNTRWFAQRGLFGNGGEEPNRSHGPRQREE